MILSTPVGRLQTATALFLALAMAATVGGALGFQHIGGYIPCKLCYEQRIPYYVGAPLMVLAFASAAFRLPPVVTRLLLFIGGLLMTYGHRRDPLGNQARLSDDHGETWSAPMIIHGDASSGDLGYPSTAEITPGKFVTVWYEKLADVPMAQLRMARWRLV